MESQPILNSYEKGTSILNSYEKGTPPRGFRYKLNSQKRASNNMLPPSSRPTNFTYKVPTRKSKRVGNIPFQVKLLDQSAYKNALKKVETIKKPGQQRNYKESIYRDYPSHPSMMSEKKSGSNHDLTFYQNQRL